ncbi:cell division protein SepF [Lentilactobacillus kribbianus]|uniref:cell division protein SepF n=1 Tax=Lentilactobacillus kribbianus TaxID=2729622 RepID=UPI0015577FD7|nr:cell division protein SepF [Lentilactobacillus kribbianus]
MPQKFNLNNFFGINDNDETVTQPVNDKKVVSMTRKQTSNVGISVIEPSVYNDVNQIAKLLMDNETVIVRFSQLDTETSKRMIDFLNGTLFAISGNIDRIGQDLFLCTPKQVRVTDNTKLDQLD